jgi:hypothetical protein
MKIVRVHLSSVSPYSQSKHYEAERKQGEGYDDWYKRTWRNHMHVDDKGLVFVPPTGLKNALSECAKFLSLPIPGKGKATYTKNFEADILVAKPIEIGIKSSDVEYERLFLPSDGKRGGGKRVWKYYPLIPKWEGDAEIVVVDDTVLQSYAPDPTKTVFEHVLEGAGQYIGLGRFRPRQNGFYGRFTISNLKITEG